MNWIFIPAIIVFALYAIYFFFFNTENRRSRKHADAVGQNTESPAQEKASEKKEEETSSKTLADYSKGNTSSSSTKTGGGWSKFWGFMLPLIMAAGAILAIVMFREELVSFWQKFDFSAFSVERAFPEDGTETSTFTKSVSSLWYLITSYWLSAIVIVVIGIIAIKKPEVAGTVLMVALLGYIVYELGNTQTSPDITRYNYKTIELTSAECDSGFATTVRIPSWQYLDLPPEREGFEVYYMDQYDKRWVIEGEYTHDSAMYACLRGTVPGVRLEYALIPL